MPLSADVYAKELYYRGHGLPLWRPEPNEFGEVQIGDVGYVLNGGFFRFFNAAELADHPLNIKGVPPDFVPLEYEPSLLHYTHNYLSPRPLCSQSVKDAGIGVGASAGVTGASLEGSYRFKCSTKQGALLVPGKDVTQALVHPNQQFIDYMLKHYKNWHTFAAQRFGLNLEPEEIVFVRGWVKTTEWVVAAFLDMETAHELSLKADLGSYSKAELTASSVQHTSTPPEMRCGPPPSVESIGAQDQCIFVSVYRLMRRLKWRIKIEARSQPVDLFRPPSPGADELGSTHAASDSDSAYTVTEYPSTMTTSDPLDFVLGYILENSTAEIAIASHGSICNILRAANCTSQTDLADALLAHTDIVVMDKPNAGMLHLEVSTEPFWAPYLPIRADEVSSASKLLNALGNEMSSVKRWYENNAVSPDRDIDIHPRKYLKLDQIPYKSSSIFLDTQTTVSFLDSTGNPFMLHVMLSQDLWGPNWEEPWTDDETAPHKICLRVQMLPDKEEHKSHSISLIIYTRNTKGMLLTKSKLGYRIAKSLKESATFLECCKERDINFDDLAIHELKRVSGGSWQPTLFVCSH